MTNLKGKRGKKKLADLLMTVLLGLIVVTGPMVAYAGVNVVYPASTTTADVDESPPITFSAGSDHSKANSAGFAGSFSTSENGGAFTITVNGLSDGKVTIDDLTNVTVDSSVNTWKMKIDTALGSGINPDSFKIRVWTGSTAPSADGDSQVCAVLDLESAADSETSSTCSDEDSKIQVILDLPSGQTTESDSVKIAPSSITFD